MHVVADETGIRRHRAVGEIDQPERALRCGNGQSGRAAIRRDDQLIGVGIELCGIGRPDHHLPRSSDHRHGGRTRADRRIALVRAA